LNKRAADEFGPILERMNDWGRQRMGGMRVGPTQAERASTAKGLDVVPVPVERPEEVEGSLTDLKQIRHDALLLVNDSVFLGNADRILTYCSERRLPTMFSTADWVMKGGLMSYEPDPTQMYRRAAAYVLKVLGGTKPSDLPVEQPTMFWLAVNAKVGKALGLTIPQSLLVRADELIE